MIRDRPVGKALTVQAWGPEFRSLLMEKQVLHICSPSTAIAKAVVKIIKRYWLTCGPANLVYAAGSNKDPISRWQERTHTWGCPLNREAMTHKSTHIYTRLKRPNEESSDHPNNMNGYRSSYERLKKNNPNRFFFQLACTLTAQYQGLQCCRMAWNSNFWRGPG